MRGAPAVAEIAGLPTLRTGVPARASAIEASDCGGDAAMDRRNGAKLARGSLVICEAELLWPVRMGSSPFKAKRQLTEEQRAAARARAKPG